MTHYMKEAERLIDAHAEAHVDFVLYGKSGVDETFTALLAHIQRDFNGTPINTADQMRTYVDAREAAGYARGLNERNAGDETLAREIDLVMSDDGVALTPGAFRALSFVRAALRGEVK